MTGLSPGRALRVQQLEQAQEALTGKDRELEQTQQALRKQLSENADLSRRFGELQEIVESLKAREAGQRPLLDVIETTVRQLRGQHMSKKQGYTPPPNMKGSGTASTPKVALFGKPTGGNVKKP